MAKYNLIRQYIQPRTGNVYIRREYDEKELPTEILNNSYYTRRVEDVKEVIKSDNTKTLTDFSKSEKTLEKKVVEYEKTTDETQVNINEASVDELVTVKGIGKTIAEKIVKSRPFNTEKELEDLIPTYPIFKEHIKLK